jgi:hypothetical protein
MKEQDFTSIQKQFLQKIEDLISKETSLVFELSEMLGISTDSAYRRMRGETLLTIDEIIKICNHYNVSFDAFSKSETGLVTFRYSDPEPSFTSFLNYQKRICDDMEKIAAFPEGRIVYAAEDIPVFYHYGFRDIACFKIFYWLKSVSNVPELQSAKYDPDLIDPEILKVSEKLYNLYKRIPSVEIWTENTVISAVKQIEYFWESGFFKNAEDALKVCNSLEEEISSIRSMAENSIKMISENNKENTSENYKLYSSDIEIANNCVLIELGDHKAVYLGHLTFYTLSTSNAEYGQKTASWLETLIKKSTLISGVSEKQRLRFFKKYFKVIDDLREKIKAEV